MPQCFFVSHDGQACAWPGFAFSPQYKCELCRRALHNCCVPEAGRPEPSGALYCGGATHCNNHPRAAAPAARDSPGGRRRTGAALVHKAAATSKAPWCEVVLLQLKRGQPWLAVVGNLLVNRACNEAFTQQVRVMLDASRRDVFRTGEVPRRVDGEPAAARRVPRCPSRPSRDVRRAAHAHWYACHRARCTTASSWPPSVISV